MPNIESLISEAHRLEESYNYWNHAYLVLVVVTAVVAGLLVLTTGLVQWVASRKAGELDSIRKAVIAAKDDQLKEEFAHRDERIATVRADADLKIAGVRADADQKIAAANKRSDELSAEANRKAAELRGQNLETEKKLEAERSTRLELEQSIAPRMLIKEVRDREIVGIEPLTPFAGTSVIVETLPDAEPSMAAGQLISILTSAGWKIDNAYRTFEIQLPPSTGVLIQPAFMDLRNASPEAKVAWGKRQEAAQALADFLIAHKWDVDVRAGDANPPNIIKITIGLKPNPYFLPEQMKKLMQEIKKGKSQPHKPPE